MKPMLKHYPDKPWERSESDIPSWGVCQYMCQQKSDGWRIEVIKDLNGEIHYFSSHNKNLGSSVEDHLKEEMSALLADVPNGSQFDGEWLSRRSHSKVDGAKPCIILFDVMRWGGDWLLKVPCWERWEILKSAIASTETILLTDMADGSFVEFYNKQKSIPQSEGIVVKHKRSTLVGDRKGLKKSGRWFKVRYRAGSDGETSLDHLRIGP